MRKLDRNEQEMARRKRIARAAFELFARSGLENTSAADIAKASFVSRTNLYRYYPSKLHMLLAHFEVTVEETRQVALRRLAEGCSPQMIWQAVAARMADLGVRYRHLVGAVAAAVLGSHSAGSQGEGSYSAGSQGEAQSTEQRLSHAGESLGALVKPVLLAMRRRGDLCEDADLELLSQLLVDSCLMALWHGHHHTKEEVQRDWLDRLSLILGGALRRDAWPRSSQLAF